MKNILITGSAGSLGNQLIKFYSKKKFNVIAVDQIDIRPKNKISKVQYYTCDLTSEISQIKLFKKIKKKYESIHICLNVAGMIHNSLIVKRTYSGFKFHNLDNKILNILRTTDFQKMKDVELKEGFVEAQDGKTHFRSGIKNQWKNKLNKKQIQKIEDTFKKIMDKFNYK